VSQAAPSIIPDLRPSSLAVRERLARRTPRRPRPARRRKPAPWVTLYDRPSRHDRTSPFPSESRPPLGLALGPDGAGAPGCHPRHVPRLRHHVGRGSPEPVRAKAGAMVRDARRGHERHDAERPLFLWRVLRARGAGGAAALVARDLRHPAPGQRPLRAAGRRGLLGPGHPPRRSRRRLLVGAVPGPDAALLWPRVRQPEGRSLCEPLCPRRVGRRVGERQGPPAGVEGDPRNRGRGGTGRRCPRGGDRAVRLRRRVVAGVSVAALPGSGARRHSPPENRAGPPGRGLARDGPPGVVGHGRVLAVGAARPGSEPSPGS
jgi:hypothetical protein